MNEILLIKSLFFFMSLWGLAVLLLWFRPRIDIIWKIMATLILGFYVWFFFDEISTGVNSLMNDWYGLSIHFIKEVLVLTFVNLFFFWPLALIIIFYKADDLGAERLLKFMVLLTLVLWVVFIIYFLFSKNLDSFIFEKLKKMIPYAK